VSEQTGYRPDLLDIGLGIDTVGEAEVFASTIDLPDGLDPSALEPICSATSGS
jgi:hypothetical protein